MRRGLWEKCQDYLRKINRDIAQLLTHSRSIGTCLEMLSMLLEQVLVFLARPFQGTEQ